jgi:hypothetical protein
MLVKQRRSRPRSRAHRAAEAFLFVATILCSHPAAAEGWTAPASIGNIQSFSSGSPSSGSVTHYFTTTSSTWTVTNGAGVCSSPLFAYIDSSQYGYRELFATAMLAKSLGKQVWLLGNCTATDYFKTHYVILLE